MKLEQLNYFLEAARQEHIGRASRILAISPSAISHSISALEEELGQKLFVRKSKNIVLTDHGHLLMKRAIELLNQAEEIKEEMTSDQIELKGHCKLAATHVLSSKFLAPAWIDVQNENPELTGELYTLRSSQVYAGVLAGEFQLGLCFSPQGHPDLTIENIYKGQLQIVIRPDHPLFQLKPHARLAQLNRYGAVLPKAFQGIDVCESHPILLKHGIKPKTDFIFDSYEMGIEKIASSHSWGFFPDIFVPWNIRKLRVIAKTPGWNAPYTISLVWQKHRYQSKALMKARESVRRHVGRAKPKY